MCCCHGHPFVQISSQRKAHVDISCCVPLFLVPSTWTHGRAQMSPILLTEGAICLLGFVRTLAGDGELFSGSVHSSEPALRKAKEKINWKQDECWGVSNKG